MKWRGRGGAGRIEDRRGRRRRLRRRPAVPDGKGGRRRHRPDPDRHPPPLPARRGRRGLGVDPGTGQFPQAPGASSTDLEKPPADDAAKFVDFVAGDVDATWKKLFADSGKTYEPATIVLYDDGVQSACGNTPSTVGPFYCPRDRKVYLDLPFMEQLQRRLDAPGDFAQAYIVAHEIGHHVQNLLGVMEDVDLRAAGEPGRRERALGAGRAAGRLPRRRLGALRLREGRPARDRRPRGGLNAAAAVGDDRIQKQSGQDVNPDSFTHGSSAQRVKWFRAGFDSGDPTACDTFKGDV